MRALADVARQMAYVTITAVAALLAFDLARKGVAESWLAFDFRGTLWDPAAAILEGRSPYPQPEVSQVDTGNPALYPPLLMLLVAPLTLLPWWLGATLWTALLIGAGSLTLRILEVRDIRCYVVALISLPVITDIAWGNATLLLVPLVALAWRWRESWLRVGVVVGLAIAAKLFLWPLLFWLVGTRRYRAAGAAGAAMVLGLFVPWGVVGLDGLRSYPDLLRVAEAVFAAHSYSVATMLSALGVGTELASWGTLVLGVAIAAVALYAGRRRADAVSISLAVLAALLGSPILWEYYYSLLLVPIAILSPRLSIAWIVPLLFYVTHELPRDRLPAKELEPGGSACCQPAGVPDASWVFNHAPPGFWPALGHAVLAIIVVAAVAWRFRLRATTPPDSGRASAARVARRST